MKQYVIEDWSAYVDAITLVGSPADWCHLTELDLWSMVLTLYDGGEQWKKTVWEQYGYRGWRVGSVSFGVSTAGSMRMAATGHLAHVIASRFAGFDLRCARIDMQVTAKLDQEASDVIRRSFVESSAYHSTNPRVRPRCTMIDGAGYGDTCYIGQRGRERFIRIYDKGAQSEQAQYQGYTRFECELAGSEASRAWYDGSDAQFGSLWIGGRVADNLRWGGCFALSSLRSVRPSECTVHDTVSDADRKIAWLKRQVRPSIDWLLTAVDRSVILSALGLSNDGEVA